MVNAADLKKLTFLPNFPLNPNFNLLQNKNKLSNLMNPLSKVNKAFKHLTDLKFINTVLNSLPVEEDKGNKSRTVRFIVYIAFTKP